MIGKLIVEIIAAALGTIGFSVMFGIPRKLYFNCALIGAAGWLVYKGAILLGAGVSLAVFLAAVVIVLSSRFTAVYRQCPATVFLIAGIFPLVPGAQIYWAAYYLVTNQLNAALSSGITALKVMIAIVLGIVFVFEIPYKVFSIAKPRKKKYICKIATLDEMHQKWDAEIGRHAEKENWIAWKAEAIDHVLAGRAVAYYGILGGEIICEATAKLYPDFAQSSGETTQERVVELCAFRTVSDYRGKGYFSRLLDFMQNDLKQKGYEKAVVGVEPDEKRNQEIYHHWGFTEYIRSGSETYPDGTVIDVMFFGKQL